MMTVPEVRLHSRISPSSYDMSEACTMSVYYRAQVPASAPGPDALVGTAAHMLFERCMKEGLDVIELSDVIELKVDGQMIPVDDAMRDIVQLAVDASREILSDRAFLVEHRLEFGFVEAYLGEPMWGHADLLAPEPPFIVIDLKAGYNFVDAGATQLGLYLLAAALRHAASLDGDGIAGTTVVIQPNAQDEPVRSHDWTWQDLRNLRNRVIDLLRRIKRQDFTYQYGSWCRWCPAAGMCPHLAAAARDFSLATIAPTPELVASGEITSAILDEWYQTVQTFNAWSKRFLAVFEEYLVHGGHSEVAKLVKKRTNRRWIDDDSTVAAKLAKLDVDPYKQSLVSPAEAERRAAPAKRSQIAKLAEKPEGELTLAPMDDKREGIEVGAKLKAALESSVAAGYLAGARTRSEQKGT